LVRFLLDENLPPSAARGLTLCTYEVDAVGDAGAPPKGSSDEDVVDWAVQNSAVLITIDRGRKNREMLRLIRTRNVRVVLAPRGTSARDLVRLFARHHDTIEQDAERNRACRYRLGKQGGLSTL
jgi:predicted nuclease of predicted toxin-antitoxin system